VYCGNPGDTREHVPSKLLYVKPYPINLATVPCCKSCNEGWSKDEQYFKLALSFLGGSEVLDAMHDEDGFTDKTLSYPEAFGLDDSILESLGVDGFGRPYFTPDVQRVQRVLEKITKGLCALRGWQVAGLSFSAICFDRVSNLLAGPTTADNLVAAFEQGPQTWSVIQSGVFEYFMFRPADETQGRAYCALRLYDSIAAIVMLGKLRSEDYAGAFVLEPIGAAVAKSGNVATHGVDALG
jgi:hypothetical protein